MAVEKKDTHQPVDFFDRVFGHFPDVFHRPMMVWSMPGPGLIQVDEFRSDGDLVIRAEMPGLDPQRDVEVTVDNDVLHIRAEHREEETKEEKDYYRREIRYGSFSRDLQLPAGATDADIKATYRHGMLEVHIPLAGTEDAKTTTRKVPVTT